MSHYVCFGTCATVKSEPAVCDVPECDFFGKTLSECHCPDGQSHQRVPAATPEEEE